MKELQTIADAMSEKKGKGILSLDLRGTASPVADYFLICSADAATNVCAIADNVEDRLQEMCSRKPVRIQGMGNGFWVIMDYSDIVVHIFKTEYRHFYRLEDLWADADRKDYIYEE